MWLIDCPDLSYLDEDEDETSPVWAVVVEGEIWLTLDPGQAVPVAFPAFGSEAGGGGESLTLTSPPDEVAAYRLTRDGHVAPIDLESVYDQPDYALLVRQAQANLDLLERCNQRMPVGTRVRYWTFSRDGPPQVGVIRAPWTILGSTSEGSVVAWIEGCTGCVVASHVEPLEEP